MGFKSTCLNDRRGARDGAAEPILAGTQGWYKAWVVNSRLSVKFETLTSNLPRNSKLTGIHDKQLETNICQNLNLNPL